MIGGVRSESKCVCRTYGARNHFATGTQGFRPGLGMCRAYGAGLLQDVRVRAMELNRVVLRAIPKVRTNLRRFAAVNRPDEDEFELRCTVAKLRQRERRRRDIS